jgi:hypothetical protein
MQAVNSGRLKRGTPALQPPGLGRRTMTMTILAKAPDGKSPGRAAPAIDVETARMRAWLSERLTGCQKEPIVEIVTLTPVLARLLLETNEKNRSVSAVALDRLKRDIVEGRWEFNGETIIIAKDGKLNDGQHRCLAVCETGRSIRTTLVFGPLRESRMTLDTGTARTVGHFLGMRGFKEANKVAAVASMIWQWREHGFIVRNPEKKPTKSQTLSTAMDESSIVDSLAYVSRERSAAVASHTVLAFVHWAIAKVANGADADRFMDAIIRGENLRRGDPILYARNRLIAMRDMGVRNPGERVELLFKAWNSDRRGETVDRITIGGNKLPKLEA